MRGKFNRILNTVIKQDFVRLFRSHLRLLQRFAIGNKFFICEDKIVVDSVCN